MTYDFKSEFDFHARCQESSRIVKKYPDRVPVIVLRGGGGSPVPDIDKHKFLVPNELTVGQFVYVVRRRIRLDPAQALFLFCGDGTLPPTSALLHDLYRDKKDEDGFMYISYAGENTFGRAAGADKK